MPTQHKLTSLSFADKVIMIAPTSEEQEARARVETIARKRRNEKQDLEEGKAGKKDGFVI